MTALLLLDFRHGQNQRDQFLGACEEIPSSGYQWTGISLIVSIRVFSQRFSHARVHDSLKQEGFKVVQDLFSVVEIVVGSA